MTTTDEILDRTSHVLKPDRVFGEPQHVGETIVIPAASIRGGGGGGGGTRGDEIGDGGGLGIFARPAGALVISDNDVQWKVPFDLNKVIVGSQLVGISFFFFGWLTERSKARVALKIARLAVRK